MITFGLTLLEICAQNQGNSVSGDIKWKNSLGGHAPRPPRRDHFQRSIITIWLLRNFCQLVEKLWTTYVTSSAKNERSRAQTKGKGHLH